MPTSYQSLHTRTRLLSVCSIQDRNFRVSRVMMVGSRMCRGGMVNSIITRSISTGGLVNGFGTCVGDGTSRVYGESEGRGYCERLTFTSGCMQSTFVPET